MTVLWIVASTDRKALNEAWSIAAAHTEYPTIAYLRFPQIIDLGPVPGEHCAHAPEMFVVARQDASVFEDLEEAVAAALRRDDCKAYVVDVA